MDPHHKSQNQPVDRSLHPTDLAASGLLLPAVILATDDGALGTRIAKAASSANARLFRAATWVEWVEMVDGRFPVLALLDLTLSGDWASAIKRCKLRPATRQTPIYAFGVEGDRVSLQDALRAGADASWPREQLEREVHALVARHVHPPIQYLDGWDDSLNERAQLGLEAFNRGDYFEQHEFFEEAWIAETRPIRQMYQGVLQVGVAFLQIQRNNWRGAVKMFRSGLPKLRNLPPVCQGIDVEALRTSALQIYAEIVVLGAARLPEFDQARFPKLERIED